MGCSVSLLMKPLNLDHDSIFYIDLKTEISKRVHLKQIEQSGSPKISHDKIIVSFQTQKSLKNH